jgi:hypothetical protein
MKKNNPLIAALPFAVLFGAIFAFLGCGVRGKPEAPLTPPELGRGQPTFKRATQEFAFPNVPSPETTPGPRKKGASPSEPAVRDSDEE